jgi:hypothetical protein
MKINSFQGLGFVAIVRMRKTDKKSAALTFGSFVSRQRNVQNYLKAQVLQARNNISIKEELKYKLSVMKLRHIRAFIARRYFIHRFNSHMMNKEKISRQSNHQIIVILLD